MLSCRMRMPGNQSTPRYASHRATCARYMAKGVTHTDVAITRPRFCYLERNDEQLRQLYEDAKASR